MHDRWRVAEEELTFLGTSSMLLVILACLIVGFGFVAVARRNVTRAAVLERVGGGLIVISLVGLGPLLAAAR